MEKQTDRLNDRARSEFSRKNRYVRGSYRDCKQFNKLLPSNHEEQFHERDRAWIFNYKSVRVGFELTIITKEKWISAQQIQKCQYAKLGHNEISYSGFKRMIKCLKYLQNVQFVKGHYIRIQSRKKLKFAVHYLTRAKASFSLVSLYGISYVLFSSRTSSSNPPDSSSFFSDKANNIKNLMKFVPLFSEAELTSFSCYRLSKLTRLSINITEEMLNFSFFTSLSTIETLKILEVEATSVKFFTEFSHKIGIIFSNLKMLRKLDFILSLKDDDDLDWEDWIKNFQNPGNSTLTIKMEVSSMVEEYIEFESSNLLATLKLPQMISKNGLRVEFVATGSPYGGNSMWYKFKFEQGQLVFNDLLVFCDYYMQLHDDVLQYGSKIREIWFDQPHNDDVCVPIQKLATLDSLKKLVINTFSWVYGGEDPLISIQDIRKVIVNKAKLENLNLNLHGLEKSPNICDLLKEFLKLPNIKTINISFDIWHLGDHNELVLLIETLNTGELFRIANLDFDDDDNDERCLDSRNLKDLSKKIELLKKSTIKFNSNSDDSYIVHLIIEKKEGKYS